MYGVSDAYDWNSIIIVCLMALGAFPCVKRYAQELCGLRCLHGVPLQPSPCAAPVEAAGGADPAQ